MVRDDLALRLTTHKLATRHWTLFQRAELATRSYEAGVMKCAFDREAVSKDTSEDNKSVDGFTR